MTVLESQGLQICAHVFFITGYKRWIHNQCVYSLARRSLWPKVLAANQRPRVDDGKRERFRCSYVFGTVKSRRLIAVLQCWVHKMRGAVTARRPPLSPLRNHTVRRLVWWQSSSGSV